MKITIETENGIYTVDEKGEETLDGLIGLMEQAARAAGFYFDGRLDLVDEKN